MSSIAIKAGKFEGFLYLLLLDQQPWEHFKGATNKDLELLWDEKCFPSTSNAYVEALAPFLSY